MTRTSIIAACLLAAAAVWPASAQEALTAAPASEPAIAVLAGNQTAELVAADRAYYFVPRHLRGRTLAIPEQVIVRFCGDFDGCELRVGMYDWDGTGRTASRETLFFYNPANKNWRAALNDRAGSNQDNVTQHINQSWACYVTDGAYDSFADRGDSDLNFGLLSWNEYNAGCLLTVID